MLPNPKFSSLPKSFWASVRTISQKIGYAKGGFVIAPTLNSIKKAFFDLELNAELLENDTAATDLANSLVEYFVYRANVLNDFVKPRLMDAERAESEFFKLRQRLNPSCPLPFNKQKGTKKAHAFLTGIVNMIIEENSPNSACDHDPRILTTVTRGGVPLRTLARRVDGAFPTSINPHAIWEIKEYYYTTTFGSRVADGVYETLLDGMELEELFEHEEVKVLHYLMVDAYKTWWDMGKSYLCRIVDMLHMGYVDEVLFGYEVVERLPEIVKEWVAATQVNSAR